jgi:integrase
MGFSRKRKGRGGKPRYTAYYNDLRGVRQSAGTFARKEDSDAAWKKAEVEIRAGLRYDPARGRQRFRQYVEKTWLPNHRMEDTTRQDYMSAIYKHIMWFFGPMKMRDIGSEQVREWITQLKARGVSPRRIQYCKTSILNAIFSTAVTDGVIILHPSHLVPTDPAPAKPRTIITPAQFELLYAALPSSDAQLLVETAIESGLRWGEITELRVRDINFATGILTVSRTVIVLTRRNHPDGGRFLVKEYPKGRKWRAFKLSDQILRKLAAHIKALSLGPDDLLFTRERMTVPHRYPASQPDPSALGTFQVGNRNYRHGTPTAYGAGRCRCEHCRHAVAAYRARRRQDGKDRPARSDGEVRELDPHPNRGTFRSGVFQPALKKAGITDFTFHGHTHASWLLHGGADLQVVKERLGHAKISTTEGYLHTLPEADETALTALAKIRVTAEQVPGEDDTGLEAARLRIQELEAAIVGLTLKFSGSGTGHPTE